MRAAPTDRAPPRVHFQYWDPVTNLFLHVLRGPPLYVLDKVVVEVGGEGRRKGAGGPSSCGVGEGAGRVGCVAAAVTAAAVVVVAAAAAGGHVVGTGGGAPLAAARSTGAKRKSGHKCLAYCEQRRSRL